PPAPLRCEHDPLFHRPALAGIERQAVTPLDDCRYPVWGEFQYQLAAADHGEDLPVHRERVRSEAASSRSEGDTFSIGQPRRDPREALVDGAATRHPGRQTWRWTIRAITTSSRGRRKLAEGVRGRGATRGRARTPGS